MNAAWHAAHPMPQKATLDQRIAWHIAHAKVCGCRAIPDKLGADMEKRGIDVAALNRAATKARTA